MPSEPTPIQIDLTPRFKRDLKQLAKRFRRIRSDLQPLIDRLQNGELPGDPLSGVKYTLFKVRVKNSDTQKGKSGGYRVIYYLKTEDRIILVTIYSKFDLSDIDGETLENAIADYERQIQDSDLD